MWVLVNTRWEFCNKSEVWIEQISAKSPTAAYTTREDIVNYRSHPPTVLSACFRDVEYASSDEVEINTQANPLTDAATEQPHRI